MMIYILLSLIVFFLVKQVSARVLQVYISSGEPEDKLNISLLYNAAAMMYITSTVFHYVTIAVGLAYLVKEYVL